MKKIIIAFLSLLLLVFPKTVLAQNEFKIDSVVTYDIASDGKTSITHKIILTNLFSDFYATSYSLFLEGVKPENIQARQDSKSLEITKNTLDQRNYSLEVHFDDQLVGKEKSREFEIFFEDRSLANKTGAVWEVSIPQLAQQDLFNSYTVIVNIPHSFGQVAYISPNPTSQSVTSKGLKLVFDKNSVTKQAIIAAFGKFQVFSFNLTYHLENPLNRSALVDIAIPSDTAFQKLNYDQINPEPLNVLVDEDGNWLARYELTSRQRVDVKTTGTVQIFAEPRAFPKPLDQVLEKNKQASQFWQVNDPQIISLAQNLITPQAIYNYVVNYLSYDYERVKPNIDRLGAKTALAEPKNAICMEFTDLFIALSRAAGIPAREINGYAYTENPEIQPLSLVSDVLHSWPEYWDSKRQLWLPIDPTWGNTTGGLDFFSKSDLRHFNFVAHGVDSQKPYAPGSYKLGPNPQKDVFVDFGQLSQTRNSTPQIKAEVVRNLPISNMKLKVIIKNPGPVALYNPVANVFFDQTLTNSRPMASLPPFAQEEFDISIPFSFLGKTTPEKLTIQVSDASIQVPTYKNSVIVANLVFLFVLVFVLIIGAYIVYSRKPWLKIKSLLGKLYAKLSIRKNKNQQTSSN